MADETTGTPESKEDVDMLLERLMNGLGDQKGYEWARVFVLKSDRISEETRTYFALKWGEETT